MLIHLFLEIYDDIPIELLEYVEDVILDRREDATERLLEYAENVNNSSSKEEKKESGEILICRKDLLTPS